MQKFGKTLITNAGRQMLTDVDGAKGKITYTKAAIYTQDIKSFKETDLIALTSLTGLQLETNLEVTDVKDNTVTVLASFNNAKVTKDLTFNSIGWFAKTSVDDSEKLLAVTPSETEQTLVAGSNGASTSSIDVEMVFARSHDTTVVVNPSSVGLVSAAQMDGAINQAKESIIDGINQLSELVDSSNSLDGQKINLDTFSKVGITKFTNCQLQTTGRIAGLDLSLTNLDGWIFNVSNKKDAAPYQQLVYVNDYGSGTLTYVRSKVNNSGNTVEDFQKVTTDQDVASLFGMSPDGVKKSYKGGTVNPDEIIDTGIYRISGSKLSAKATDRSLDSLYWGWLINLNYENTSTSNAIYQILIANDLVLFRNISVKNSKYPPFDGVAYSSDIARITNNLAKVHTVENPILVDSKTNADALTSPGIYYSDSGFDFGSNAPADYRKGKSYILVLLGDRPDNSTVYYQQFLFQATKDVYNIWYRAGYSYGSNFYYTFGFQNLKDIYGKLKQISINGGKPIDPDDKGVANLDIPKTDLSGLETKADAKSAHDTLAASITSTRNSLSGDIKNTHDSLSTDIKTARDALNADIAKRVLSVNEKKPDSLGNVVLTDFDHPTQVFNGTTVNLNTITATGLYELRNATIQNSLSSLPGFTQLNATYAYLIAINNPSLNNTFQILICRQLKNFVLDYRYINKTYNDYPDFKRIIDSSDYTNLFNKIDLVDKKELVHFCDDLDSGVAYSKANPNVFVATP